MKSSAWLCVILTAILFYLKLTSQIDWSWLWVFSPMWIPPVVIMLFFAVVFAGAFVFLYTKSVIDSLRFSYKVRKLHRAINKELDRVDKEFGIEKH